MKRAAKGRAPRSRCAGCHRLVPSYDVVSAGSPGEGYRTLCNQCFNSEVAKADGLDKFEHFPFEPVQLADSTGKTHEFHFRTHLFGPGVALEAFELRNGEPAGYQFEITGDPQEDQLVLLGRLIDRMRRALAIQHLKNGELGLGIADRVVRAGIEWDDAEDGRVPLLIIDGRAISWELFGRMLMTFEGWQFKLEIRDKSEDL